MNPEHDQYHLDIYERNREKIYYKIKIRELIQKNQLLV